MAGNRCNGKSPGMRGVKFLILKSCSTSREAFLNLLIIDKMLLNNMAGNRCNGKSPGMRGLKKI
jgi:hypothetical protein